MGVFVIYQANVTDHESALFYLPIMVSPVWYHASQMGGCVGQAIQARHISRVEPWRAVRLRSFE